MTWTLVSGTPVYPILTWKSWVTAVFVIGLLVAEILIFLAFMFIGNWKVKKYESMMKDKSLWKV